MFPVYLIYKIRNVDGALPRHTTHPAPPPYPRDIRLGSSTEPLYSTPLHRPVLTFNHVIHRKQAQTSPLNDSPAACDRKQTITHFRIGTYVRSNKRFHKLFARQTTIVSLWGRAEGVGGMRTSEMKLDIMVEYRSVGKLLACDNFATIFSDVLVGFTF